MKQERWKSILKPLTILPVIVMLCTIFGFSNQNGTTSGGLSQKVSRQIVTVCDTLFHQDLAEETIEHYTEKIEYPLRKAAHATECEYWRIDPETGEEQIPKPGDNVLLTLAIGLPQRLGSFIGFSKYSWKDRYTSSNFAPVAISFATDSTTAR